MNSFESLPPVRRVSAWELQDGKTLTGATEADAKLQQLALVFSDWYAKNRYLRNDANVVQDDDLLLYWLREFRADLQRLFALMDELESEKSDGDADPYAYEYAP